ncbi:MAG: hypothetical protein GX055_11890 [Desulfovibrionales bacterium]|nr:hypothetical protein [Desulfovibrionales bacterium]
MDVHSFLTDHQNSLVAQWADALFQTYPEEGAKFFSGSKNQFANPAGHTFRTNLDIIFRTLASGQGAAACTKELDEIMRIRAVQGFSPSVALCFLPALKEIVLREAVKIFPDKSVDELLRDWNRTVDQLIMLGFDLYVNCREILWQQKANQLYNRTHKLLERANLLKEEVAG